MNPFKWWADTICDHPPTPKAIWAFYFSKDETIAAKVILRTYFCLMISVPIAMVYTAFF